MNRLLLHLEIMLMIACDLHKELADQGFKDLQVDIQKITKQLEQLLHVIEEK